MARGRRSAPEALRSYKLWNVLTQLGYWEMTKMRNEVRLFAYRPRISVLMPVYDPEAAWLTRTLDSVMSQTYPDWELCVCDDGSTGEHVRQTFGLYE